MFSHTKKALFIPLFVLSIFIALALACNGGSGGSAPTQPPTDTPTTVPVARELPDFAIVGYWREPDESIPAQPNTPVYFHIQVTNRGSANYYHYIVVSGPGNVSGGFNELMAGETKEAVVEFIAYGDSITVSNMYFTVDPDNVTEEEREDNNKLGPLTVIYGGG